MKKKKYSYCAVFNYADDGISIEFPDLPGCISCGFSQDEALRMAKEALELYLEGMQGNMIPEARDKNTIEIDVKNQRVFSIIVEIE